MSEPLTFVVVLSFVVSLHVCLFVLCSCLSFVVIWLLLLVGGVVCCSCFSLVVGSTVAG